MDKSIRDKVRRSIVRKRGLPSDCVTLRLPNAPSLQFYCVYGHGKETEVSCPPGWWSWSGFDDKVESEIILVSRSSSQFSRRWHGTSVYRYTTDRFGDEDDGEAVDIETCVKDNTCPQQDLHSPPEIPFSRSWIDREYSHESSYPKVGPTYRKS
jgi:phospholipid:diacylglycerol acyltransferase